jgi:hypothetical protein
LAQKEDKDYLNLKGTRNDIRKEFDPFDVDVCGNYGRNTILGIRSLLNVITSLPSRQILYPVNACDTSGSVARGSTGVAGLLHAAYHRFKGKSMFGIIVQKALTR